MSPLFLAVGLSLATPALAADGLALFERVKSLEGNWKSSEKEPARYVSLRVIANGAAVLETVSGPDRTKVLSAAVYHLESGRLVVMHYGPAGALRLEAKSTGRLEFEGKGPLTSVTLTPKGDDRLTHESAGAFGKATLDLVREYVDTLK